MPFSSKYSQLGVCDRRPSPDLRPLPPLTKITVWVRHEREGSSGGRAPRPPKMLPAPADATDLEPLSDRRVRLARTDSGPQPGWACLAGGVGCAPVASAAKGWSGKGRLSVTAGS